MEWQLFLGEVGGEGEGDSTETPAVVEVDGQLLEADECGERDKRRRIR